MSPRLYYPFAADMSSLPSSNPFRQRHGIVALNKPSGLSSAQCLVAFKRQGQKKIGHAGTLDPMASGVLVVLLGNATKLAGWIQSGGNKVYSGRIQLGIETDTWDITGTALKEQACGHITKEEAKAAIADWPGLEIQEVPAFSAAKFKGQPLYKLARKGHDTPVKTKSVRIQSAELLAFDLPFLDFRVACGSGVYIRSLAHSLGMRLGVGATLAKLVREYSHPFGMADAVELETIKSGLQDEHIQPLASGLPDWPVVDLAACDAKRARNGNPVKAELDASHAILSYQGQAIALASLCRDRSGCQWCIERGLWSQD